MNSELSLQITSMADIFIILLLFLLKSVGGGLIELTPAQGIHLPEAHAGEGALTDSVKLEIGESTVLVDGKPVAQIHGFAFAPSEISARGGARPILQALELARKGKPAGADADPGTRPPSLLVVADQRVPYSTIKAVLTSAALSGFMDYKLAVAAAD